MITSYTCTQLLALAFENKKIFSVDPARGYSSKIFIGFLELDHLDDEIEEFKAQDAHFDKGIEKPIELQK